MKVLIVGNGGREHALLWKLRRDAPQVEFLITRGNGGTITQATSLPLDPGDIPAIIAWARSEQPALVVVGPEAPLAQGLVDALQQEHVPAFGPTAAAAHIESSKAFAKALMESAGVPTAGYRTFTDFSAAADFITGHGAPVVVKASGLAAGKGAVVCQDVEEALAAARSMLEDAAFGAAGREIVVEECMSGEELSIFALCDGEHAVVLPGAQDHKRVGEGDTGPNTGGMGAYAPVTLHTPALEERVQREILQPTLAALRAAGCPFQGLLYAGLMLTPDGPKVVEFNARFGDPETQVVLPLLAADLFEALLAIARGSSIAGWQPALAAGAALTTVLATAGYPGKVTSGQPIHIPADLQDRDDVVIFHAGTALRDGQLITAGGRVLAATGLGATLEDAARASREAAAAIEFEGCHYRRDIGWRELARQRAALA